jgi:hypothetical protein
MHVRTVLWDQYMIYWPLEGIHSKQYPHAIYIYLNWANTSFYLAQALASHTINRNNSRNSLSIRMLFKPQILRYCDMEVLLGFRFERHMCDDVYRDVEDISSSLPTWSSGRLPLSGKS